MKPLRLVFLVVLTTINGLAQEDEAKSLFEKGIDSNEPANAIAYFEQAANIAHSANLHGNLANLYYEAGRNGKAILHFRKALLLDPENGNLKASLNEVRQASQLPPVEHDSFFEPSSLEFWCWITASLFWIGIFTVLSCARSSFPSYWKIAVFTIWIALIGFGISATWKANENLSLLLREAVAIAPEATEEKNFVEVIQLRSPAGKKIGSLKPGESVNVDLDETGNPKRSMISEQNAISDNKELKQLCYFVRDLSDSKKGWVKSTEIHFVLH